jgi:hypothetical protein
MYQTIGISEISRSKMAGFIIVFALKRMSSVSHITAHMKKATNNQFKTKSFMLAITDPKLE